MRGVLRDFAFGARFAVAGGRAARVRTALTAIGVGLGVALLFVAASVPQMLQGREDRTDARQASFDTAPVSDRSFLHTEVSTLFRTDTVHGVALRPDGPRAPVPPGVAKLPGPGEMVVSPALAELLASPGGALLKDRFPYRIAGTIGDAGLAGPGELFLYVHDPGVADAPRVSRADHFGHGEGKRPLDATLVLVVTVACVVLLLPVLVYVAVAVRFGGERRDRRLAALRLMGADTAMTRRIAAGEALAGAVLGLLLGGVFFLLGRPFAGRVTVWDVNAFPGDLVPEPALVAAVVVAVPLCAVAVALFALRGIALEPLGVVRGGAPRPRRVWWRMVPVAAGLVLLLVPGERLDAVSAPLDTYRVAAGAVLALTGLTALLPWLVEAAVRWLRGGPPSWQLATRRLQTGSGTAARAVSGIVVAAAGAIALQMVFGAVQSDFMRPTAMDGARAQLQMWTAAKDSRAAGALIDGVKDAEGVAGVIATIEGGARRPGPPRAGEDFAPTTALKVGDCASLRELGELPSCRDGDVFIARAHGLDGPPDDYLAKTARPGAVVDLRDEGERPVLWRIPESARVVEARRDPMGWMPFGIYATHGALDAGLLEDPEATAMVRLDPAVPDAAEHARNAAARFDPLIRVVTVQDVERDRQYTSVRTGVLAAATATMALIALSLLVSTVEQLRERRRSLSTLVAFGARRATLGWSVLWQTAVPVALGMGLAVGGGLLLGLALVRGMGKAVAGWWVFLPVAGLGAALLLGVALLSLPPLWRLMRADGLRTE
ncbi:FtsX-like permease family protein [Streptomyces sp. TRM76323]|uniref:FtsX-like permease family protein n=1 Tax=Streptomyces tamarix TaxID=3078565 RepID=A0ABU3QPL7_9ACTN|nr:FtsX-like permease family protein [Streptomyces tamarix]MDT9684698.1 FtsX-like permease family protein [Streptomyces tamarix]